MVLEAFERHHAHRARLPVLLHLVGNLFGDALELVEIRDEVPRRRQLAQDRQGAGEERLIVIGQLRREAIELLDVFFPQGARLGFGHRPRDPGMALALARDPPRQFRGQELVALEVDPPVLDQGRFLEAVPQPVRFLHQLAALGRDLTNLSVELGRAGLGEIGDDPGDRFLELLAAVVVALEHAHAQ